MTLPPTYFESVLTQIKTWVNITNGCVECTPTHPHKYAHRCLFTSMCSVPTYMQQPILPLPWSNTVVADAFQVGLLIECTEHSDHFLQDNREHYLCIFSTEEGLGTGVVGQFLNNKKPHSMQIHSQQWPHQNDWMALDNKGANSTTLIGHPPHFKHYCYHPLRNRTVSV